MFPYRKLSSTKQTVYPSQNYVIISTDPNLRVQAHDLWSLPHSPTPSLPSSSHLKQASCSSLDLGPCCPLSLACSSPELHPWNSLLHLLQFSAQRPPPGQTLSWSPRLPCLVPPFPIQYLPTPSLHPALLLARPRFTTRQTAVDVSVCDLLPFAAM